MTFQWPNERQWFTVGLFWLVVFMLILGQCDPSLWNKQTYLAILQALVLTGILSMAGGFHFSANKSDENRTANMGKALDAINAAAPVASGQPDDHVNVKVN